MTLKSDILALAAKGEFGAALAHLIDNLPSPSTPGAQITHKFPFAFNTPNLLTGATAVFTDGYTPAVNDILHDAWFEIDTAWDGITPKADFGTFVGSQGLWHAQDPSWVVEMTAADAEFVGAGLLMGSNLYDYALMEPALSLGPPVQPSNTARFLPAKFTAINPIKVCVSQDGTKTGADPGSTQGAAILYVVTSTPHV